MIKVIIADDHQMIREGLRSLLQKEADINVTGEAKDGRSAVSLIRELLPDVVVMDLRMPDLNGIEATRQVILAHPAIKIVGLSADSSRSLICEMLRAGASGFVVKTAAFEELVAAVRMVMKGQLYLSPSIAGTVLESYIRGAKDEHPGAFSALSIREREVLQLMSEGHATKEIAMSLHVSVKTVETHRRNLMEKLKLDSVAELTKYAIREGITSV